MCVLDEITKREVRFYWVTADSYRGTFPSKKGLATPLVLETSWTIKGERDPAELSLVSYSSKGSVNTCVKMSYTFPPKI